MSLVHPNVQGSDPQSPTVPTTQSQPMHDVSTDQTEQHPPGGTPGHLQKRRVRRTLTNPLSPNLSLEWSIYTTSCDVTWSCHTPNERPGSLLYVGISCSQVAPAVHRQRPGEAGAHRHLVIFKNIVSNPDLVKPITPRRLMGSGRDQYQNVGLDLCFRLI